MTEAFLQYLWQHRLFEDSLVTVDGQRVEVLRPGLLNTDAGPDFIDARLRLNGCLWAGNVEVHLRSSDWKRHRHSSDPSYDGVLLHVVYQHDMEVLTPSGNPMLTLEVCQAIPEMVWRNYESLLQPPPSLTVACADRLQQVSQLVFHSAIDKLVVERLQRKTEMVSRMLNEVRGSYEHCCYLLLAHYFGGRVNAFPFELLAKSIDMNLLARWRDDLLRIEALLFGQAGMLEGYFDDEYPRQLQVDYQALRTAVHLTPIATHLWRFFRIRPAGFPTIRISQFAALVAKSHALFSHLLEMDRVDDLRRCLEVDASDYWTTHYRFDKPAPPQRKSVGAAFVDTLIINAWIPLLFEYAQRHDDDKLRQQALDLLQQLTPEENHIVRTWRSVDVQVDNAATSQALIQLFSNYCELRHCLQCPLGYYMLTTPKE